MDSEWYVLLIYLTILSPIFPIFLLLTLKAKYDFNIKTVLLIILISSLISDLSSLLLSFKGLNNHLVLNSYVLISGVSFLYYYKRIIHKKWMNYFFSFVTILFVILNFSESFYWSDHYTSNTVSSSSLSVMLIILSLIFFFHRMNVIQTRDEIFDYLFWINSAVLIYFGSTFILTLFEDLIVNIPQEIFYSIWMIQLIANLTFVLMVTKGIWTARKI